jgi:hypothetical protein
MLSDQFENFINYLRLQLPGLDPDMQISGKTVTIQPEVSLYCEVEDTKSTGGNLRLLLNIWLEDNVEEGVMVDLTLQENLQSIMCLFKDEMIPVQVLMCQPDTECIGKIMAHVVARKAKYAVTVEENLSENQAIFRLDLGGYVLEGTANRDEVAKYFNWQPLTLRERMAL